MSFVGAVLISGRQTCRGQRETSYSKQSIHSVDTENQPKRPPVGNPPLFIYYRPIITRTGGSTSFIPKHTSKQAADIINFLSFSSLHSDEIGHFWGPRIALKKNHSLPLGAQRAAFFLVATNRRPRTCAYLFSGGWKLKTITHPGRLLLSPTCSSAETKEIQLEVPT